MRLLTILRSSVLVALFLVAVPVVTAVALPTKLDTALASSERSNGSPTAVPILYKRLNNVWQSFLAPEGWQVNYITFAHILPLQLAAFGLQELYQAVAVSAFTNQLSHTPLSNAVVISIGGFTLTLSSNELIPWTLLHAFALRMWTISGEGFTPGYTIDFTGPHGTVLRASLRVSRGIGGNPGSKPSAPMPDSG